MHRNTHQVYCKLNKAIHSFIQTISIAPLQVHFYSEALPTHHRYCAGVSRRSATGNCELTTCPRAPHGGESGSRTHHPLVESYRLNQCAAMFHVILLSLPLSSSPLLNL